MYDIGGYIDRSGKLCLKPLTPDAEQDIEEWVEKFKRDPHGSVDYETKMAEQEYQNYKRQMQRYGYDKHGSQQKRFGFQPNSYYMPQPPDFSPQAHFPLWPFVLPFILEGQGGGSGGSGGGGSGGGTSNYRRGGDYDGSDRGNENPRDTGRGDIPRR